MLAVLDKHFGGSGLVRRASDLANAKPAPTKVEALVVIAPKARDEEEVVVKINPAPSEEIDRLNARVAQAGSQNKLAQELGINQAYISMLLKGKKNITNELREALGWELK